MKNWLLMLLMGVLFVVAGIIALANPLPATLTVEIFAGWSFLILGLISLFEAFSAQGWGGKIWSLLMAAVMVLVGIFLLYNPLQGVIALTILLGISFVAAGIFKVIAGWGILHTNLRWGVVLSGTLSALLGAMILTNIPGSAVVSLGILLGVELLSDGIALTLMALWRKSHRNKGM